jgi:hypothetical protein
MLAIELKDRPGIVASVLSATVGTSVFAGVSVIAGAIVAASVGGAALFFVGIAFRKSWTLKTQRKPGPLPEGLGRAAFIVVAAAAVALGFVFSIARVSAEHIRREQRFIAVFLCAVGFDAIVVEPIKCLVLSMAQRRAATAAEEEAAKRVDEVRRQTKEQALRIATPGRRSGRGGNSGLGARGRAFGMYDDDMSFDGAATIMSVDPDEFMTTGNPAASTAWASVADADDLEDATSAEGFEDPDDFRTVVVSTAGGDGMSTVAQSVDVDDDLFASDTEATASEVSRATGFTSNGTGFGTDDDDDNDASGFEEVEVPDDDGFESEAATDLELATAGSGTHTSSDRHPYAMSATSRHIDPYDV